MVKTGAELLKEVIDDVTLDRLLDMQPKEVNIPELTKFLRKKRALFIEAEQNKGVKDVGGSEVLSSEGSEGSVEDSTDLA